MVQENQESLRTPDRSTWSNDADNIERFLQEDGHPIWGFVIYRCTYADDSEWGEFMKRLKHETEGVFKDEQCNGMDIYDRLRWTVFDEKSSFDGVDDSVVRQHFTNWMKSAPQEEQNTTRGLSQRYRFCVQVDQDALDSVVENDSDSNLKDGWVKLVWADYTDHLRELEIKYPVKPRLIPPDPLEIHPWMMVTYQYLLPGMYILLRDWSDWDREYRAPPQVASI
ncbi:hypothetical protein EJ08DRAFT_647982 [Tothia fuscella]|uniref:Uncharacterized protein n=1 Tax=Tothia fuscella TaxID=1048955 RepID=A0A9P4NWP9_9PEZI|nr:hypothetical protein EJ08DRAFT_647982 [Tothia fuscella]